MASNIPKFASFRPKPKVPAEAPKAPQRPEKAEKPEKREKASKYKAPKPTTEKRSHLPEKDQQTIYFIDRKGDPANVTYGSVNRYSVPPYRRYGHGCVLGIPSDRRIDRDGTTEKELVLTPAKGRRQERLLTSRHVARENARALRFVKATADPRPSQDLDYIALSATGKRKRDTDVGPHDVDYRSIDRSSGSAEPSDPDTKYESGTEMDDASSEVAQRNAVLIRRTRDHPSELQAWLDLIDHQEAMMGLGRSSLELSSSDKQHLADVRVSAYEQALKKIGSDQDSQIKLHLGLMTEASRAWDEERLTRKWAEVLAKYPRSLQLWMKYLDFVQTGFVRFKYEKCRATFHKCLEALRSSTDAVPPETYLYVVIRLTSMIRQAGYQELAFAIWQSLLEFNLLAPQSSTNGHAGSDALSLFEEFWESEVARVGEPDAKGWGNFNRDENPSPVAGSSGLAPPGQLDATWESFQEREVAHIVASRYPGRTTDDAGEDDPFHLILFSDIEECLQVLPRETPDMLILEAFLCFCHLPPFPQVGSSQQRWWLDPLLRSDSTSAGTRLDQSDSFTHTVSKFMDCPFSYFQMTLELLFDHGFPERAGAIDLDFVRRVLKLLASDAARDEVLGEYLLAFELNYFPSEAFKTAKQMLKARPTSIRLYNAYGLVESRRGNSAKADQVFSTALSMGKSATPFSRPGSLQLFTNWVWESLRRGEKTAALWRLVSSHGEVAKRSEDQSKQPDQTTLLRGRAILSDAKERALLGRDYLSATICTSLLALLAYLSGDQKPESALLVHDTLSVWFEEHSLSQSPTAELHAQSIAQFLTYHATNAPIVKPSLLRTTVEPLILRFPDNTILLSLYAANEARFSIDDRVRGIMRQRVLGTDKGSSMAGWFFAIHYEIGKGVIAGSTSHSVRALFKKAEDDVGAHSPALWKSHVLFELEEAKKEREKRPAKRPRKDGTKRKDETRLEESWGRVKETFFRGLTRLPWCKDYMMLAFTHLGEDVLTQEEQRSVYNVMVEKELRIYVDMDTSAT